MSRTYLGLLLILLAGTGIALAGLTLTGSPVEVRRAKFDKARSLHLEVTSLKLDKLYEKNGKLPGSLSDVSFNKNKNQKYLKDPQSEDYFEYRPSERNYQLCATFGSDTKTKEDFEDSLLSFKGAASILADDENLLPSERDTLSVPSASFPGKKVDFTKHGKGKECFTLELQPRFTFDDFPSFGGGLTSCSAGSPSQAYTSAKILQINRSARTVTIDKATTPFKMCTNSSYLAATGEKITEFTFFTGDTVDLTADSGGRIVSLKLLE